MAFPAFYAQVPGITLRDPLAELLGAAEGGCIDYGYADAVRLAGHSCPTVAGAYVLAVRMLRRLFGADLPERGALRVEFRGAQEDGVTGVMAAIFSLLTGAAGLGGFKGLAGNYARRNLLVFAVGDLAEEVRLSRLADGASVSASLDLSYLPSDPVLSRLLGRILANQAESKERKEFALRWQARVETLLLEFFDHPGVVRFADQAIS